jgi:hypothetical protein
MHKFFANLQIERIVFWALIVATGLLVTPFVGIISL